MRNKLALIAIGIWLVSVPSIFGQPRAQVPTGSAVEHQQALQRQQEEANAQETTKAEWWLVYVGIAQAIALIGTLVAIGYQGIKTAAAAEATKEAAEATRNAAEATRESVVEIRKQVGLMERQTIETEKAADAALLNARAALDNVKALVASERAWIDGRLLRPSGVTGNRYQLVIKNHGKTPAHVHSYEVGYGLFQDKVSMEALIKAVRPANFLLGSDAERFLDDMIDMGRLFPRADGTQLGAFCVTVEYSDLVSGSNSSGDPHRTFFVYSYHPLLSHLDRIPVDQYT